MRALGAEFCAEAPDAGRPVRRFMVGEQGEVDQIDERQAYAIEHLLSISHAGVDELGDERLCRGTAITRIEEQCLEPPEQMRHVRLRVVDHQFSTEVGDLQVRVTRRQNITDGQLARRVGHGQELYRPVPGGGTKACEAWPMAKYARVERAVWRQGPDRVLVARLDGDDTELLGAAALVWLALDEPRAATELVDELAEFGASAAEVADALHQLCEAGLVEPA